MIQNVEDFWNRKYELMAKIREGFCDNWVGNFGIWNPPTLTRSLEWIDRESVESDGIPVEHEVEPLRFVIPREMPIEIKRQDVGKV